MLVSFTYLIKALAKYNTRSLCLMIKLTNKKIAQFPGLINPFETFGVRPWNKKREEDS